MSEFKYSMETLSNRAGEAHVAGKGFVEMTQEEFDWYKSEVEHFIGIERALGDGGISEPTKLEEWTIRGVPIKVVDEL